MKTSSIQLICSFYRQLGPAVRSLVDQSDINELLKKKVMEAIDGTDYDASLLSRYSMSTGKPTLSGETVENASAVLDVNALMDAYDATSDVVSFLIN